MSHELAGRRVDPHAFLLSLWSTTTMYLPRAPRIMNGPRCGVATYDPGTHIKRGDTVPPGGRMASLTARALHLHVHFEFHVPIRLSALDPTAR
jgi:hypothetical protein